MTSSSIKQSKAAISKILEGNEEVKVRDLVKAVAATKPAGHFNFNDHVGKKDPTYYDGVGAEIVYWHVDLPGGVKWTFSACEDDMPVGEIRAQLKDLPEDILDLQLKGADPESILDENGVCSKEGWLSEKQIWAEIWGA